MSKWVYKQYLIIFIYFHCAYRALMQFSNILHTYVFFAPALLWWKSYLFNIASSHKVWGEWYKKYVDRSFRVVCCFVISLYAWIWWNQLFNRRFFCWVFERLKRLFLYYSFLMWLINATSKKICETHKIAWKRSGPKHFNVYYIVCIGRKSCSMNEFTINFSKKFGKIWY